jgi:hypothetical protein
VLHYSNYVQQDGVQCHGVDGCPSESRSRRASWRVQFPPKSGFEGGYVGTFRLVAVRTLTRGRD